MWQEINYKKDLNDLLVPNISYKVIPAEIESIEKNSIAQEIGFESGDSIISINGKKPRDLIDYQILISEEILKISVLDKNHKVHDISIEKDQDINLGINFSIIADQGFNAFEVLNTSINQLKFYFLSAKMNIGEPIRYGDILRILKNVDGLLDVVHLEIVRKISYLLYPIIPQSSLKALMIFNIKESELKFSTLENHNYLKKNSDLNKIDILFKKIEKNND